MNIVADVYNFVHVIFMCDVQYKTSTLPIAYVVKFLRHTYVGHLYIMYADDRYSKKYVTAFCTEVVTPSLIWFNSCINMYGRKIYVMSRNHNKVSRDSVAVSLQVFDFGETTLTIVC